MKRKVGETCIEDNKLTIGYGTKDCDLVLWIKNSSSVVEGCGSTTCRDTSNEAEVVWIGVEFTELRLWTCCGSEIGELVLVVDDSNQEASNRW